MKILFTHRYYWPDTAPYALMLRVIAQHFSSQGHDVNVFTSKVSYRKFKNVGNTNIKDKINVHRTWVFNESTRNPFLRVLNVLIYCFALFFHILRTKPDIVTASTFPPVIAAWCSSSAARIVGAKFVYHIMDIHPEVSQYSGGLLGRGLMFKFMLMLDNQMLRRSHSVIVLSGDMANSIKNRNLKDLPIHIINNFMLEAEAEAEVALPADLIKPLNKIRVVFAGNIGRYQNLELLVEGFEKCLSENPNLELLFLGDGLLLPYLKKRWGGNPQILFSDFLPFAQAKILIANADIGLVSLKPNLYKVASPSKLQTYLGLGVPIFAILEKNSELARTIETKRLGTVAETVSVEDVSSALKAHLRKAFNRDQILEWYKEEASRDVILSKLSRAILG